MEIEYEKLIGTFRAKDPDGHAYDLRMFATFWIGSSAFDPYGMTTPEEGLKVICDAAGNVVFWKGKGRYTMISPSPPFHDVPLTSDDPNAP